MTPVTSLADLVLLRESVSLECKLAAGRDGKGALPDDFWPTYSAFANTDGGVVLLGVRERKGQLELTGIENPDKLRADLFNQLNNRQKVSVNLLTDANVQELRMDGKVVLVVDVPRASRKQRPVHLTPNPLGGHTYRRLNEGDRPLPDEDVKRMLAEQVEDSRDARILPHFGLKDLDADSLKAYRNIFRADKPDHPWLALDDQGFLQMLGGWQQDRATGESGLTVAGLLMFGSWPSIAQALPMACRLHGAHFSAGGEAACGLRAAQPRCPASARGAGVARGRERLPQPHHAADVSDDWPGGAGRVGDVAHRAWLEGPGARHALERALRAAGAHGA